MANKKLDLPPGHTWKSYTKFLLSTLPEDNAKHYKDRFIRFIQYWRKHGAAVEDGHLSILPIDIYQDTGAISTRGSKNKRVVKCRAIVDELPGLDTKADYVTWKRFAMCILRNDITCQTLSFGLTKEQLTARKMIKEKYSKLL